METNKEWFEDSEKEDSNVQIDEYDLSSTPNDFNVITIYNFMDSGVVKIPAIQRNFVWDIKKSSKLVESLILGLPVPQIFLYEESRNSFSIIDGQQRLMSIYYFIKQRFPKEDKRVELRKIFDEFGEVPEKILNNDDYFIDFKLILPEAVPDKKNKFNGLKYSTLDEYKTTFTLRPIRNVIVKQNSPKNDDSSIYEIFNRLNTGGVNLQPQEIRASLYHSKFYDMLYRVNELPKWRAILSMQDPDLHSKDIEILLRSFAFLINGEYYRPPLTKFLNNFSMNCKKNPQEKNEYLEQLFVSFLDSLEDLNDNPFKNKYSKKFVIHLFEAVFVVCCETAFKDKKLLTTKIPNEKIILLSQDSLFATYSQGGTTQISNVKNRIVRAREVLNIQ
jgi:uncharacterized protein with ParB-like and HNH nuclease domain